MRFRASDAALLQSRRLRCELLQTGFGFPDALIQIGRFRI